MLSDWANQATSPNPLFNQLLQNSTQPAGNIGEMMSFQDDLGKVRLGTPWKMAAGLGASLLAPKVVKDWETDDSLMGQLRRLVL